MSSAIIIFAPGFEETEAVTPADILRRAGVNLSLVGLDSLSVTGSHGITFKMDRTLRENEDVDAVILPGGMPGAANLGGSKLLLGVLRKQFDAGKTVGAICAAPGMVLGRNGLLKGRRATCYPGYQEHFGPDARFVEEPVVVDRNLITSRGPATALAFGLALAEALAGEPQATKTAKAMLYSV